MQTDVIKMLWNELNFGTLVDYHQNKYLFQYGKMNRQVFRNLNAYLNDISSYLNELLDELYAHRDLTLGHIKAVVRAKGRSIIYSQQDERMLPVMP